MHYAKYVLKITFVAVVLILIILMIKYKPMYKVTIAGETIGYVANKKEIEKIINNYKNPEESNIAYVDIENMPKYQLNLVSWGVQDETEAVLQKIKESSIVTYKLFAITLDYEPKQYVTTVAEAEKVVEEIKKEYDGIVDLNIGVQEIYTNDLENVKSIDTNIAIAKLDEEIKDDTKGSTINDIILSKPISNTGYVSYRFGARWGRNHDGIDIAAVMGTPIYSCSRGTVKFTGWFGGYGNLVIVDHGNGIETYYGHCSKIYVTEGTEVTKDTILAAVGSTGNSTGPHLHLEIRKNGVPQNPQNYLYK